jgi:hypothetical protein
VAESKESDAQYTNQLDASSSSSVVNKPLVPAIGLQSLGIEVFGGSSQEMKPESDQAEEDDELINKAKDQEDDEIRKLVPEIQIR